MVIAKGITIANGAKMLANDSLISTDTPKAIKKIKERTKNEQMARIDVEKSFVIFSPKL